MTHAHLSKEDKSAVTVTCSTYYSHPEIAYTGRTGALPNFVPTHIIMLLHKINLHGKVDLPRPLSKENIWTKSGAYPWCV